MTVVFATLAVHSQNMSTAAPGEVKLLHPGDLVAVELPPNCRLYGGVSEIEQTLEDAWDALRDLATHRPGSPESLKLIEIANAVIGVRAILAGPVAIVELPDGSHSAQIAERRAARDRPQVLPRGQPLHERLYRGRARPLVRRAVEEGAAVTRPPPCVCGHSHSIHMTHRETERRCTAFTAETPCECREYEPQLIVEVPPRHAMTQSVSATVKCGRCDMDLTNLAVEGKFGHVCGNPERPPSASPGVEEAYREMRATAEMLDDAMRDGSYGDRMLAAKAMVADATWLVQKLREDK